MQPERLPPTPPPAVAIGIAVRDPNVREVLLGLLRLNRMRVRGVAAPLPQIDVGPPTAGTSLLVGFISSAEDAVYFLASLREAGNPPSIVLVPPDVDARIVEQFDQRTTRVLRLPDDAQSIADAIRAQLAPPAADVGRSPGARPTALPEAS
jgi:hypothetical protein